MRGLIAGLKELTVKLPPDVKVIPGHGVISNLDDVRSFVKMLKETLAVVEQGVKQGKPWISSSRKKYWNHGNRSRTSSSQRTPI